ncbi:MAG: nucleoside triphosphate pyrophosphohydrolase [Desulfovibrio sp.]|jgi:ATP diphosphatase|nr:nucleoside triphosphate pyrophosphohydrolase [Desulfovibrio sp.]
MGSSALEDLQEVVERLLAPDGCPWDREQTPESLADYFVEESHELASAIRGGDPGQVCEELGDLAFLMVMLARICQGRGQFKLDDALETSRAKMVRRHPHVFGDTVFDSREEQLRTWERIKRDEHAEGEDAPQGVFDSLPQSLPALIKAYRIHSKAARVGFTWPEDEDVETQAESEWLEWLDASMRKDKEAQRHELGDLLFTLVELGRRNGLKANEALDLATRRFLRRFAAMEGMARAQGKEFANLDLDAQNDLWDAVKAEEGKGAGTAPTGEGRESGGGDAGDASAAGIDGGEKRP